MQVTFNSDINFNGRFNTQKFIKNRIQYRKAQHYANMLYKEVTNTIGAKDFCFRDLKLTDPFEGIQNNIKIFEGMTVKEILHICENLHIIAVKRGCKHMCGHCYAEAKPNNATMSYEDFHSITTGIQKFKKRFRNLDIYSENLSLTEEQPTFRTTELFFDADCMDIIIKNKKGKEYDFPFLAKEIYENMGRKSVFDTSGWYKNNTELQQRAEKYVKYYSNSKNMESLAQFNVSFNVFNATYIASVKALERGDIEKSQKLRKRFVDDMVNTLFTFTPVSLRQEFNILLRAFDSKTKHAKHFNVDDLKKLINEVKDGLDKRYREDLSGSKKIIQNESDYGLYSHFMEKALSSIDTDLNPTGRMRNFIKERNIDPKYLDDADEKTQYFMDFYNEDADYALAFMRKIIDVDGRVYNMNYAAIFPTELQLNIQGKDITAPPLAGMKKDFVIKI